MFGKDGIYHIRILRGNNVIVPTFDIDGDSKPSNREVVKQLMEKLGVD